MIFFLVNFVLSSFVSFFGWRMGYCCLTCHLYVLFIHGFYKRSYYHIWFIFYCKCPYKSICFNKFFLITRLTFLLIVIQPQETPVITNFQNRNKITNIDTKLMYKDIFLELPPKAFKAVVCWNINFPCFVKEKNVETKHSQLTDLIRIGFYIF